MGFLKGILDALEGPRFRAVHRDGSEGEFILAWSGDYRVRWYRGPRTGTQYVPARDVSLFEMPGDWVVPSRS